MLLKRPCRTTNANQIWREDGGRKIGLIITAAGRAAVATDTFPTVSMPMSAKSTVLSPLIVPARATKTGTVLGLFRRNGGATLPELTDATGWLPHTTRAALTGLRKKGHAITKSKRGDAICYAISSVA